MIILVICFFVLLAVVIGVVAINGQKDNTDNGTDYIVHETDEDSVEEKSENGLKESDSEDGPVLNKDNMIDFNGDKSHSDKTDKNGKADNTNNTDSVEDTDKVNGDNQDSENKSETEEPSNDESNESEEPEDSKVPDTGAWGIFY